MSWFLGIHKQSNQGGSSTSTDNQDTLYASDGKIKDERKVTLLKSLILKFKDFNSGLVVKGDGNSSGVIEVRNKHNAFSFYTFKSALQFWSSKAKKEFLRYFVETDKLEVNSGIRVRGKVYDANTNKIKPNANIETDADGKLVLVEKGETVTSDSGWVSLVPYLTSDWIEYNSNYRVEYRLIGNVAYLRGLIKGGTSKEVLKNIPKEIIPNRKVYFTNTLGSKNVFGKQEPTLVIGTHGTIESRRYSKEWTSIACSYLVD